MKKRLLLLIMFIIFILSSSILVLVLKYLDPIEYFAIGIGTLVFSFIFSVSTFFSLILYFIKKIYFRGNVNIDTVLISFRQSFLISVFFLILIFFNYYNAPILLTSALAFVVLFCLELFVRTHN